MTRRFRSNDHHFVVHLFELTKLIVCQRDKMLPTDTDDEKCPLENIYRRSHAVVQWAVEGQAQELALLVADDGLPLVREGLNMSPTISRMASNVLGISRTSQGFRGSTTRTLIGFARRAVL